MISDPELLLHIWSPYHITFIGILRSELFWGPLQPILPLDINISIRVECAAWDEEKMSRGAHYEKERWSDRMRGKTRPAAKLLDHQELAFETTEREKKMITARGWNSGACIASVAFSPSSSQRSSSSSSFFLSAVINVRIDRSSGINCIVSHEHLVVPPIGLPAKPFFLTLPDFHFLLFIFFHLLFPPFPLIFIIFSLPFFDSAHPEHFRSPSTCSFLLHLSSFFHHQKSSSLLEPERNDILLLSPWDGSIY